MIDLNMKRKVKKIMLIIALVLCCVTLTACSGNQSSRSNQGSQSLANSRQSISGHSLRNQKVLIVYYSLSGTTENVAKQLKQKTNGTLYELAVTRPYSQDAQITSARAKKEIRIENLPTLKGTLPNLSQYDVILIGGPVWSGTVSSPVFSYLQRVNFRGKIVAPFWTDSGKPGNYATDFNEHVKDGNLIKGLDISGETGDALGQKLDTWLSSIH